MSFVSVTLLVLAAAASAPAGDDRDLPFPPLLFDPPPEVAPAPAAPIASPAPIASSTALPSPITSPAPVSSAAPITTPAPAASPSVAASSVTSASAPATPRLSTPVEPRSGAADVPPTAPARAAPGRAGLLASRVPWLDGGFGAMTLRLTSLDDAFAVLSGGSLDFTRGRWYGGLGLASGATSTVALTYAGLRGGATVASFGDLDVTAGMLLGAGVAARHGPSGRERVGVVAWEPEVAVRARLLPWLRAHAALGYRMADAGDWDGPSGDALGGLGLALGLDFGRP